MKEPTNRLSAEMRRLRLEAGLSGVEAGKLAGLNQAKVSRTETGAYMPTPEQVEALCRAYKAPAELRRELVSMTRELREQRISARVVVAKGGWQLQEQIGRIEAISGRVRALVPTLVPGILQTRAYIIALMGPVNMLPSDIERTVEARLTRQGLLETDREFEFILSEGALRWNMGGAAVMVEQLDRLIQESTRPNVRLGIIPWTTPVTVSLTHTFDIYDSRAVIFGTQSFTPVITKPDDVQQYEKHWTYVEQFASYDDEARAIIKRVRRDYYSIL